MDKEILRILKNLDCLDLYPKTDSEKKCFSILMKTNCVEKYIIARKNFIKKIKHEFFWVDPMNAFCWSDTDDGDMFWGKVYNLYCLYYYTMK